MPTDTGIESGPALIVVEERPFNAETELTALGDGTPRTPDFFVRSNFDVPALSPADWSLEITGHVNRPLRLDYATLRSRPMSATHLAVECAGNGRTMMRPVPSGTPWGLGAISAATFRGVSLRALLDEAGIRDGAVEVLFRGSDAGEITPGRNIGFERSLPLAEALREDILIGLEMNGEPLTPSHGFPARLVVPGYYGVAWVKWLRSIEVLTTPFKGYFQTERYVYRNDPSYPPDHPVTRMKVRSLITSHGDGAAVASGDVALSGIAWSGEAAIAAVDISDDGGTTWTRATLNGPAAAGDTTAWHVLWTPRADGPARVRVRATDAAGNIQPSLPAVNALGYGNNMVQEIELYVGSAGTTDL